MSNNFPYKIIFKEILAGKSIGRTLQNIALKKVFLFGDVLDICGGYKPSYKRFINHDSGIWFRADMDNEKAPDFLIDTNNIDSLGESRFDNAVLLNSINLFDDPLDILKKVHVILKPNGILIVSFPFLTGYKPEPNDFYRFTNYAAVNIMQKAGFKVEEATVYQGFFGVILDFLSPVLRRLFIFPLVSLVFVYFDSHVNIKNIYGGVLIRAKKKET